MAPPGRRSPRRRPPARSVRSMPRTGGGSARVNRRPAVTEAPPGRSSETSGPSSRCRAHCGCSTETTRGTPVLPERGPCWRLQPTAARAGGWFCCLRCPTLCLDVSDHGPGLGHDLAVRVLHRRLAKGKAPGAVPYSRPCNQAAGPGGPEKIHLQVGGDGRLALLGDGERNGGQRLVRQRRDGSTVHDRPAPDWKPLRLRGHVPRKDELSVRDLHDAGPDVGHHPRSGPLLVKLRQRPHAVWLLLPVHGEVARSAGGADPSRLRCSSTTGATS